MHGDQIPNLGEKPGARAEIFGFILAGNVRTGPDNLAAAFLEFNRASGDSLSPNLLVALVGVALSWGTLTNKQTGRIEKHRGQYVLTVPQSGPARWKSEWSATAAEYVGLSRDVDAFRELVRWIRVVYSRGRTTPVESLERYYAAASVRPSQVQTYPKLPLSC